MTDPLVVGVLYPSEWNFDFDQHLAELAAVDPRVEIVVEPYEEPSELRSGRGVPPYDAVRHLAPSLTAAQRHALARIECCVALDLPFDVATVAPRLRWVQALAAGVAHLESAGLRGAGIRLTNASGANATSIAEFVFARILGEFKQTRRLDATQQRRQWRPVFGDEIAGKTVGLIGFGPINQAVARRARAFELEVIVVRRRIGAQGLRRQHRPLPRQPASPQRDLPLEAERIGRRSHRITRALSEAVARAARERSEQEREAPRFRRQGLSPIRARSQPNDQNRSAVPPRQASCWAPPRSAKASIPSRTSSR